VSLWTGFGDTATPMRTIHHGEVIGSSEIAVSMKLIDPWTARGGQHKVAQTKARLR